MASQHNGLPRDEELTAYLDGELGVAERVALEELLGKNPALAARLEQLRSGGRPFVEAFAPLLRSAPTERLNALLSGAEAPPQRSRFRAMLAAAGLVLFIAGGGVGYAISILQPPPIAQPNWRQTVAEYMSLYVPDTLAGIPENRDAQAAQLKSLSEKIGVELDPDIVALPDRPLKVGIFLNFRNRPLAEILYLSPTEGPFAFCIIVNDRPDEEMKFEQREGYNIVYWAKNGRGYMVIGKTPRERLEALASDLASRIS
jgi:hypothetical protein